MITAELVRRGRWTRRSRTLRAAIGDERSAAPVRPGPQAVRAGRARRRLRRLPHPAGLRLIGWSRHDASSALTRRAAIDRAGRAPTPTWRHAIPGDRGARQPVHTVYVPADRSTPTRGRRGVPTAREALDRTAGCVTELADALGCAPSLGGRGRRPGARPSSSAEPIEDLRVDFEDGYGNRRRRPRRTRPSSRRRGAGRARRGRRRAAVPRASGSSRFEAPTRRRGLRTLDLFVGELVAPARHHRRLRHHPAQGDVGRPGRGDGDALRALEAAHGLPPGSLRFEIQVETPQAILGADGTALGRPR